MFKWNESRGGWFIAAVSIVVLWLWATNSLSLYIHPRYFTFTAIMALLALLAVVARAFVRSSSTDEDHEHDHGSRWARFVSSALGVGAIGVLVVLPPALLGPDTALNRAVNASSVATAAPAPQEGGVGDQVFAGYTVRDWASVLYYESDPGFYRGKPVDVVGFIVPDEDANDVFLLTRFVVSCCAVDAQPVGVPVYLPDWQSQFETGTWLQIQGEFVVNPSGQSSSSIALKPVQIAPAEVPDEPYLY